MKPRLTISLDPKAYDQLRALAREEDRSLSWLVGQAIKDFLGRHTIAEQLEIPVSAPGDER